MTRRRLIIILFALVVLGIVVWLMIRPHEARLSVEAVSGTTPQITTPREETLPTINVAEAVGWEEGEMPTPAEELAVNLFADNLDHPRWMLTLENGDVLVAETRQPPREYRGITGWLERRLMTRAGALGPSANRITLLRDVDGDGTADQRSALLDADNGLNSPFGMTVTEGYLYVANTDALVRFAFEPGQTEIDGEGEVIVELPANAPNSHWTKNVVAHPDNPNLLYVAVGSTSNIGENGMAAEENRAAVLEVNVEDRAFRIFAAGLRNPVGLDWEPTRNRLFTVVNERDMLGGDLVPDYLTEVVFGAHFGWPGVYWGRYLDERVVPMTPRMLEYARVPDYALGPHTASLGLEFADRARLGEQFSNGAFIGQHGSWNRRPRSGYKVVFVPFVNGRPEGDMVDVLTGFLSEDGEARGRPVGVMTDATGALLVADDVGNRIWRVSNPAARLQTSDDEG
ncbi:PQQ-dependent sugar dehydrogenase [Parasphingopyxis lamellibrachiae]|uniref:Glucose/arabinose dehydrogenase n=1 Tax=Parasphingopyxis lamellibrachiae TaxID=680125 RepID=A0A3D9FIY0_9SPHN|nr:sorbosone dehydrogenase family protein [Parasphingopyxis lamellibrachiae]RED17527.1 glucose/arabinose dehydrogenase [Parasphingopyxis lamellibrachiae]